MHDILINKPVSQSQAIKHPTLQTVNMSDREKPRRSIAQPTSPSVNQ